MKILKGTLLLWLVAALAACAVGPRPQDPRYVRDGKAYGVTKGLFRSRWWNFYERGASFSDGKFWREAEDDLRTALRLRSKDQRRARTYGLHFVDYFPHRELGVVLYQQERYEESVKELTTSLETVKTARAEFYLDRARKALIQARGQDTGAPVIVLESPAREEVLSNSLKWTVSGTVRDDIAEKSGNRFAVETCHIKIKDSDLTAHIWRFLYDVARQYRESFDVYGTKKSFEWTLVENEPHVLHTAKKPEPEIPEKIEVPDYAYLLPEPIRRFTRPQEIHDAEHLSFLQGGGHGGSHPHLANEFVSALLEDRDPWPNAVTSANWTCVGICAHESATRGGEVVRLPDFTLQ